MRRYGRNLIPFSVHRFHPDTDEASHKIHQSCRRTSSDEGFLVVQLQVFCLLLGVLACVSARKQKAASASLFDQRKARSGATEKRRQSDGMELTSLGEETVPLTDSNTPLEVV